MPNAPFSNPTAAREKLASVDVASTARDVGGEFCFPWKRCCASIFRSLFADQARSPSDWLAMYMTPSCIWTMTGGTGACSATSISLTAQLPLVQLCLSLYCCFQFVRPPLLIRCSSSSHLEAFDAKCRFFPAVVTSLRPGKRLALGLTKRS